MTFIVLHTTIDTVMVETHGMTHWCREKEVEKTKRRALEELLCKNTLRCNSKNIADAAAFCRSAP